MRNIKRCRAFIDASRARTYLSIPCGVEELMNFYNIILKRARRRAGRLLERHRQSLVGRC